MIKVKHPRYIPLFSVYVDEEKVQRVAEDRFLSRVGDLFEYVPSPSHVTLSEGHYLIVRDGEDRELAVDSLGIAADITLYREDVKKAAKDLISDGGDRSLDDEGTFGFARAGDTIRCMWLDGQDVMRKEVLLIHELEKVIFP